MYRREIERRPDRACFSSREEAGRRLAGRKSAENTSQGLLSAGFFCHLLFPHLQLDDLRTQLLPVLYLGPRTHNAGQRTIHSLQQVLVVMATWIIRLKTSTSRWKKISVPHLQT